LENSDIRVSDTQFRLVDHAADIGISVSGKSLKSLFLNAAKGLVHVVFQCSKVPTFQPKNIEVAVSAIDGDQLLVKWLQEILFLINAKRFIPMGFKILSLTKRMLKAHVSYVPFDPETHEIRRELKAVTYHGLSIKKSGGQFRATVIFDI